MSYHPLTNETGGNSLERRVEADRILKMLNESGIVGSMTPKEESFIGQIEDGDFVSPKQLFWLRDIKDKYL